MATIEEKLALRRKLRQRKEGVFEPSRVAAITELERRGIPEEQAVIETEPEEFTGPTFLEAAAEEAPEAIGGLVGGVVTRSPKGAAIGAGLGGAAGEAYKQVGQHMVGAEEAPQTVGEAVERMGKAGGRQALYELGGRAIVGAGRRMIAPFRKDLIPEAEIAEKTLDKYMPQYTEGLRIFKKPTTILPAEATENRALDILQNVSEKSLIGGGNIREMKLLRETAVNDMIDDVINQFGQRADPDLVGDVFVAAVEKRMEPTRILTSMMYNNVDNMTQGVTVSTKELKKFVKPLLARAKEIGSVEAANAGDDLVRAISELPDNINYATAKDLRSRLISKIDEFKVINKTAPALGKAKKAMTLIDQATESSLRKSSPEALALWRQANKLYKQGNERFNNKFIRRLAKKAIDDGEPEAIAKNIFKPGAVSNIRKAKQAVDKETWKELKSWYVQDSMRRATSTESGVIGGVALENRLLGKTGMGDKALREIFEPEELASLTDAMKTLKIIQKRQGEGIGGMAIQLGQAGAVASILTGRGEGVATVLLGGPYVLAKLMTNPKTAKWLKQGATLPANSPQLGAIITKLVGAATEIDLNMQRETHKRRQQILDIQEQEGTPTF